MSLLMDALRKAEQAKKQAAGIPAGTVSPVEPLMHGGKQAVREPQLSLEVLEPSKDASLEMSEPVEGNQGRAAQDKGGSGEPTLPSVRGLGNAPVVAEETVVVMEEDVAVPPELDSDPGQVSGRGPGPGLSVEPPGAGAPLSADAVTAHSERETQPDSTEAPVARPSVASAESSRQTARTVFAAKKEYQRRSRNRRLLVLGGVGGIAILSVAGFFFMTWRSLMPSAVSVVAVEQNISPQGLGAVSSPEPLPAAGGEAGALTRETGTALQDPVGVARISPAPMSESRGASGPSSPSAPPSLSTAAITEAPPSSQVRQDLPPSPSGASEAELPSNALLEPSRPVPASIVITHRSTRPQASSLLTAAYEAYQKGDFVQARKGYQQVLQDDAKSRGALLGLAAIAMQGHEDTLARDLYLRLLDQDPGDPLARAGLLAIAPTGDPARQESELKLLLEQHPQSAPLFFSLGSLYAASQRWNEAQQAYFNAMQAAKNDAAKTGGVSPDYPFNLAVTLEHLGQLKPALKFYHEALELAAGQSAGFDAGALATRLQTLDQSERP